METKTKKKIREVLEHPAMASALLLILLPVVALYLSCLVTAQRAGAAYVQLFANPLALLLGWILLILPAAAVYALTSRMWAAWLGCALPSLLLALISYYKTAINGTPLMLSDFTLFGQAAEIAGFAMPQIRITGAVWISLLLFFGILAGLIVIRQQLPPCRVLRFGAGICACAALLLLVCGPASALGVKLADGLQTQEERIDAVGVVDGMYCAAVSGAATYAENAANAAELEPLEADEEPVAETITPTVIFLMSESFFDITELPNLTFYQDPIPVFHQLEQTCSNGDFLTNAYCGGTGYVEMEVLTGLCGAFLQESDTLTSLPNEVYSGLPCISDVFSSYGYRKEFLHSYTDRLYNRRVIYDAFGFDSVRFSETFPEDAEQKGGYLSDMALAEEIIASYEAKDPAQPLMMYAISMENHQPYYADKFEEASGIPMSSSILTDDELAVVDSIVYGLHDADAALGRLVEYFDTVEEPVMLVFWGDHLPNMTMPDGVSAYEKLGKCPTTDTLLWSPETLEDMLTTNYVIWTNFGLPKEEKTLGSTFFGVNVLERLNFSLTDYYAWLRDGPADCCTIYRPRLYVDETGVAYGSIPEEDAAIMSDYAARVCDAAYGGGQLYHHQRAAAEEDEAAEETEVVEADGEAASPAENAGEAEPEPESVTE